MISRLRHFRIFGPLASASLLLLVILVWNWPRRSACPPENPEFASIDGRAYCLGDLRSFTNGQVRFTSRGALETAVDDFLNSRSLRQQAEELGTRLGREATVGEVLKAVAPDLDDSMAVPDVDIEGYYAQHIEEFVRPEGISISWLRVDDDGPPSYGADQMQALYVRAQMNLSELDFDRFLRRARSDAVETGETGFISCGADHSDALPAPLVAEACKRRESGVRTLVGPFSVAGAWYLGRVAGYRAHREQGLSSVRASIASRLSAEKRQIRRESAVRQVRRDREIYIDWDVLTPLVSPPSLDLKASNSDRPPSVPGGHLVRAEHP